MNAAATTFPQAKSSPNAFALLAKMNPNPGSLTKHQQAVLEHIRQHQPIGLGAMAKAFKSNPRTLGNHLRALRLAGLIQHEGPGRFTRWSVVRQESASPLKPIEQVSSVWHYARRCAA